MVRAWGAPARSTTLEGDRQAHTWVSEAQTSRGFLYPSVGIFGGSGNVGVGVGVGAGTPLGSELKRCERTLIFSGGQVVDQTWNGADEYCRTFGRA